MAGGACARFSGGPATSNVRSGMTGLRRFPTFNRSRRCLRCVDSRASSVTRSRPSAGEPINARSPNPEALRSLFLPCRARRDNSAPISRKPTGAGHHYIVQPRSSRVTTRGRPRTGHIPSGAAGHAYAHSTFSQPTPIHGTVRRTALVVRAFRSRPLRKAESHVHDRPVALRAHCEAASLEHIQHGDIFREDLGDQLTKSGFTAEGCEMAHQC